MAVLGAWVPGFFGKRTREDAFLFNESLFAGFVFSLPGSQGLPDSWRRGACIANLSKISLLVAEGTMRRCRAWARVAERLGFSFRSASDCDSLVAGDCRPGDSVAA